MQQVKLTSDFSYDHINIKNIFWKRSPLKIRFYSNLKCKISIFDMLLICSAIYIINKRTEIRLIFPSFSMKYKFYILSKLIATASMVKSSICKLPLNWDTYIFIFNFTSKLLEAVSLKAKKHS